MEKKKNTITFQHCEDLANTRKTISELIKRLTKIVEEETFHTEPEEQWKYIWGEKENAVSSLNKLTTLLVKIIPLERELCANDEGEVELPISEEDQAIIDRFIEKEIERREKE